ncbi:hypothetical protein AAMO2058_000363700 [Amorphochlora amoebiformis]
MADNWLHPPVPLVALVGMSEIHTAIIGNMPKIKRLRLISHQLYDELPKPKQKTEIKDWDAHVPSGILKSNWVEKHMTQLPAVVCLLHEWDENKDWHSQTVSVASAVNNFRARNSLRNFEVIILIVRHRNAVEDERELEEKHRQMCKDAGIPSRNFMLLTTTDLKASLKRLEECLHAAATRKYREMYKRVKKLKDRVPRGIKRVQVRYHFKMGFYAELYSDQYLALSHYSSAYNYLGQIRIDRGSEDVIELKVVAQVIVFKIIYLLLHMNKVVDALTQFRHHINFYRHHRGLPSLLFHHHAWMSRQYRTFGEFWEEAPSAQRQSSKTQNSGYFYQAAAEHAIIRKNSALTALEATGMGKLRPSTSMPKTEYLGQLLTLAERTYGAHASAGSGTGHLHHHVVVQRVLALEAKQDHSEGVLVLLTRAYENFKRQRCSRMILHVASHMAKEYLSSGNPNMANKFFDRIARTYRKEKWNVVLRDILTKALQCARALNRSSNAASYTLELLSAQMSSSPSERKRLGKDLLEAGAINQPPPPEANMLVRPLLNSKGSGIAVAGLDLEALPETAVFIVPAESDIFICKGGFPNRPDQDEKEACVTVTDSKAIVKLQITSKFPVEVAFAKIVVVFEGGVLPLSILPQSLQAGANPEFKQEILRFQDLWFKEGETESVEFEIPMPPPEDCKLKEGRAKNVEISHILLAFFPPESDEKSEVQTPIVLKCPCASAPPGCKSTAVIPPVKSNATIHFVNYQPPGIVGERIPLNLRIDAGKDTLKDAKLKLQIAGAPQVVSSASPVAPTTPLSPRNIIQRLDNVGPMLGITATHSEGSSSEIKLPEVKAGDSHNVTIWLSARDAITQAKGLEIVTCVQYTNQDDRVVLCDSRANIWFVRALTAAVRIFPIATPKIPKNLAPGGSPRVVANEPYIVHTILENISPHPLHLDPLYMDLKACGSAAPSVPQPDKLQRPLNPREKLTSSFVVTSTKIGSVEKAILVARWRRASSSKDKKEDNQPSTSELALYENRVAVPKFNVVSPVFRVTVDVKRRCTVFETVIMSVRVANSTIEPQRIEVSIAPSRGTDELAIAGSTSSSFHIPPLSTHELKFSLTPCHCGSIALPKIQLYSRRYAKFIYDSNDLGIIFVQPESRHLEEKVKNEQD